MLTHLWHNRSTKKRNFALIERAKQSWQTQLFNQKKREKTHINKISCKKEEFTTDDNKILWKSFQKLYLNKFENLKEIFSS